MKQATQVSEIQGAVSPSPLIDSAEFTAFYGERFQSVEADTTAFMRLELEKNYRGSPYRRFLTGHSGSGKSTELTRLSLDLSQKFEFIRLMAQDELSPFSAQPFDLLHLMALRITERARDLDLSMSESIHKRLEIWFSQVTTKETQRRGTGSSAEVSASVGTPKLWSFLQMAATVKGEAKYSSDRTEESVRQRLQRLSELRDLANDVFSEANIALLNSTGREWVFLIEDLDKQSVSEAVLETLFVKYANLWAELQVHFICTIPLWLTFGEKGANLRLETKVLVDIPVFDQTHRVHNKGREILGNILDKRVSPELFAAGSKEFLVQAAGGNLRDMFSITAKAATFAELRGLSQIEMPQAERAVNDLRNEYLRRLGETNPETEIPYEQKAKVLQEIYRGSPRIIQTPVLYRLLRSRVVHEYNRTYWYGLPPMMVDILIQQGYLDAGSRGGLER
ncbi:MAG: hypothetical protein HY820_14445 [Acidobacteria bacterium]|nr:hypothetical protein [Acidobacteriota bacterium]